MKKIFTAILSIFMIFALVGCANTNNEARLAKRLSANTNNLLNAINNLEEVTNEDVTILEFTNGESINIQTQSTRNTKKLSKIKQLFKRNNDLMNIKNIDNYNRKVEKSTNNYIYTNQDFYTPKYVSNESVSKNYLDLFKYKMENLYNVTNDCNYVNNECNRCNKELRTAIDECKFLCSKLESGEIKLSEEQVNTCNTYAKQINTCVKQIKDCKGDCNNYLQTLRALKGYFGSNSDTLSLNYLNLLGCLENRLSCYNQSLECVNNCNNLLKSCYSPKEENNADNVTPYRNLIEQNKNNNQNANNTNKQQTQQITNPNRNYPINNQPNNYPTNPNVAYNNGYYINGYNSNNGYFNNGYGFNPYNQTPNNVNTYGPINRNIDTYKNITPNNNTINSNQNSNLVNEENKTVISKESERENGNIENIDNNIENIENNVENNIDNELKNEENKSIERENENILSENENDTKPEDIHKDGMPHKEKLRRFERKEKEDEIVSLKEEKFVNSEIKTIPEKDFIVY